MKSVYTGGEKVAEFESYDELRVGENKPSFIYEGNELVYPNPVKDGLVLWYDFSGRTNTDGQRGAAEDLSGNGNHGTLQNFNYSAESGYDKNKLLFDGVDDLINNGAEPLLQLDGKNDTLEFSVEVLNLVHKASSVLTTIVNGIEKDILLYSDWGRISRLDTTPNLHFYNQGRESFIGKKVIVSLVRDNGINRAYINGILESEQTYSIVESEALNIKSISKTSLSLASDLGVFSIKVYNRPLTPEEIEHNYAIEKERFGIE